MANDNRNFGLNNPKQCSDAIQNKQLVINANLFPITEANLRNDSAKENSPQKIISSKSRFKFSILDGTSVSSNIKISQVAGISKRSDFAAKLQYEHEFGAVDKNSDDEDLGIAYTVRFTYGTYEGKSPAEALLSDPDGKNKFNEIFKSLRANLEAHPDNANIMDAMTEAYNLFKDNKLSEEIIKKAKEKDEIELAYNSKFIGGNLRDKTPAQILLEESDGINILDNQYDFLAKNADKYANNRKLMQAITVAKELFKNGKLSKERVDNKKVSNFEILPEVPKANYYENVKKVINNKDLYPVNSIHIYCRVGEKNPVTIEIKNYYSPVKVNPDGRVTATASEMDKDTYQNAEINLSIDVWLGMVADLERQIEVFSIINGNEAFKLANKIAYENNPNN